MKRGVGGLRASLKSLEPLWSPANIWWLTSSDYPPPLSILYLPHPFQSSQSLKSCQWWLLACQGKQQTPARAISLVGFTLDWRDPWYLSAQISGPHNSLLKDICAQTRRQLSQWKANWHLAQVWTCHLQFHKRHIWRWWSKHKIPPRFSNIWKCNLLLIKLVECRICHA